ncbi:MFS transporter [Tropicimonas sp. IMCC6043]|uniref:MFS transporter n=1 Tax=Tropicimonas sp. IMCC6043 TaxID=2510645 RepID=UPI00101C9133|nr:MFS transporter [Tropicimonas sp. IMCC6043]RYH07664.1 MFS transporter [Tropicimonas sp. IMCC6043]
MDSTGLSRWRILFYALLTSLTALSIDALLPGLQIIGATMAPAPPLSTQHVISLFIFGMAFGELLIGPLADALGRKRALALGIGIYGLGTLIALSAGRLEVLIAGRIIQGIGVAGPKIATRAMIRDQFEGAVMARVMSFMFTLFILVPMAAPMLGQALIALGGWRAIFVLYLVMATLLGLAMVLKHPETLPPERRIPFRPKLIWLNCLRIGSDRRVGLLIVATGLVFGAQLLYLSTAAQLFDDGFGIRESFPLWFAILASGIGIASYVNGRLVRRAGMERMIRPAFLGLAASGFLLLCETWVSGGPPPFAVFMGLGFLAFFSIGVLFGNMNALAMLTLGEVAGYGASLIASGSSLVATVFAIALGAFYDGSTLSLSAGFLAAGLGAAALTRLALDRAATPIAAVR